MQFELSPLSPEQAETLKALCKNDKYTIFLNFDGRVFPIATIHRHKGCLEDLFQKVVDAIMANDIKI